MKQIKMTDLKDIESFKKFGETFTKIEADDTHHIYVFKREKKYPGHIKVSYEVVKGVKYKNYDRKEVFIYPQSERFGLYGFYIFGPEDYCRKRIEYRKECLYKRGEDN